ncbi:MAG: GNAT family N-acetyltransferase [Candidatus Eremiobacteraeota bacterium]|nr:GNAT family N-acetyltransferase [Candidatus Eremiobacteraeota bacterium]
MPVNLLAALGEERFGLAALARAHDTAARAGYVLRRIDGSDDQLAAWIDFHFPGSWWSYEAGAGSAWIGERDGRIAGFAAFGARGLKFRWLRAWRERADAGVFGPFGIAEAHRGSGLGDALLTAALCGLRESGYRFALIPAVGGDALIAMYAHRTGATVAEEISYETERFRAVILASGAGTNARNVLERVRAGALSLDVAAVIANDARAGALDAAREHGVEASAVVWERARETRAAYDARLIGAVASARPQLVLLLGWMHLLPPAFLARFPETLNLHPSFLPLDPAVDEVLAPDDTVIPALRGAHALRDALRAGVPWTGASVHYVTEATDRGAVLVRIPLPVGEATTPEALRERVRPAEFLAVEAAIRRWSFER